MKTRRLVRFGLWFTETERAGLGRLSEQEGLSEAATLRQILRKELALGGGATAPVASVPDSSRPVYLAWEIADEPGVYRCLMYDHGIGTKPQLETWADTLSVNMYFVSLAEQQAALRNKGM